MSIWQTSQICGEEIKVAGLAGGRTVVRDKMLTTSSHFDVAFVRPLHTLYISISGWPIHRDWQAVLVATPTRSHLMFCFVLSCADLGDGIGELACQYGTLTISLAAIPNKR